MISAEPQLNKIIQSRFGVHVSSLGFVQMEAERAECV